MEPHGFNEPLQVIFRNIYPFDACMARKAHFYAQSTLTKFYAVFVVGSSLSGCYTQKKMLGVEKYYVYLGSGAFGNSATWDDSRTFFSRITTCHLELTVHPDHPPHPVQ